MVGRERNDSGTSRAGRSIKVIVILLPRDSWSETHAKTAVLVIGKLERNKMHVSKGMEVEPLVYMKVIILAVVTIVLKEIVKLKQDVP